MAVDSVRHPAVDGAFVDALSRAVGDPERIVQAMAARGHHAVGFANAVAGLPDVVVYARHRDEVARVARVCHEHRVPLIPFGAGTSVEGHVIATRGGVCLDLSQMADVAEIDAENLTATVQPGVTRSQLNARAGEHGLFFPVDPGADASIGGMIATNASGTTTVRYGSMRHQILRLEAVLADGRTIRTGTLARKSSAGYDLTSLLVGSEGTLAIVTEAVLRLRGIPEHTVALRALFPDPVAACRCAAQCMAYGLSPSRLELMDEATVRLLNEFAESALPVASCLVIEAEGLASTAHDEIAQATELAREHGGHSFETISDPTARARLWRERHNVANVFAASAAGRHMKSTDICVPVSRMPEGVARARALMDRHGFDGIVAGHVGDGNYHAAFLYDADDPPQVAKADEIVAELVTHALSVGGTCSGEHGIGVGKKRFLVDQHADLIPLMRQIKDSFDPRGILNPDKVFDPEASVR